MKVNQVTRRTIDWQGLPETRKIHENCKLTITDNKVTLSGPKGGHIADGFVKSISTTYNGSTNQIHLDVMVEVSWKRSEYRLEQWYVAF